MQVINTLLGTPLGYLMYLCYRAAGNYGLAIILFTILTRVLLFPLSLMSQKNALIMAGIQPALSDIKRRNQGNSRLMAEEQKALFKKEGYSSLKSLLPLLVQIPVILGLIQVIYHPLNHLLHLDPASIAALLDRVSSLTGLSAAELGSQAQLKALELIQANPEAFSGLAGTEAVRAMDTLFLGVNLSHIPSLFSWTLLYPLLSGLSALLLALYQNRYYVLQINQGRLQKWGQTLFLVAFSAFFAWILPCGVGLYWITGNLLSILVLWLSNKIYDPSKVLAALELEKPARQSREERQAERALQKRMKDRQKEDRRRFFSAPDKSLVFYSEGSGFYKYFSGYIDYVLDHSDLAVHYVTSDFNDRIFEQKRKGLETYYIGPLALIQFMMRMDADMVVMTTPDLQNYHIKRSLVRKDVEYVYLDHGMTSFHLMLRKGALDHFDTIFCYGPNHMEEVRQTEARYGLPEKRLVRTGYPLLDSMLDSVRELGPVENDPPIILIAPSWQEDNLLEYCLDEILAPLLQTDFRLIVRPHPEFVKRFPKKIEDMVDRYKDYPDERLLFQTDFSSSETVYTADLVMTDWSSIAQEFSYATGRPSLFINTPMKVMNPDYQDIQAVALDISLRDVIGISVGLEDLPRLAEIAEDLIRHRETWRNRIQAAVRENIFDIGSGARGGGQYILDRLFRKESASEELSLLPRVEEQLRTLSADGIPDPEKAERFLAKKMETEPDGQSRGAILLELLDGLSGQAEDRREDA